MKTLTLEISLKPFKKTDEGYIENICEKLFSQWKTLAEGFSDISVLLWSADGSEILDYKGELDDDFEWAYFLGSANPLEDWNKKIDPNGIGLHVKNYLYTDNPPKMTYGILKKIVSAIKSAGLKILNKSITVGATFDPGPEFAKSDFKYGRHREICFGNSMGNRSMVCSYALLNGDTRRYAGFINGIRDKTPFGTFFGRQTNIFLKDMNMDYIWFSNGFGFGTEAWSAVGAIFDGKCFHTDRLDSIKERVVEFWSLFRKECPKYPIHTRGTNMSLGIDYSTDGVPLEAIYNGGYNITPPPNSPWAAINGDFGLELAGHMSRIAQLPGGAFTYRFYLHDPWWVNSPWYDRYGGKPHDIYLPLAVSRIDKDGRIHNADNMNILTVDNSYGDMPDNCVYESLPHFMKAIKDMPDDVAPFVWVYPFSDYSNAKDEKLLKEMLYNDWFIRSTINNGLPLSCVVSQENFINLFNKEIFNKSVIVSPVPQKNSEYEKKALEYIESGRRIVFYGSLKNAGEKFLNAFNIEVDKELYGEFEITDICKRPQKIICAEFVNNGGLEAVLKDKNTQILAKTESRVLSVRYKNAVWVRGLTSYSGVRDDGVFINSEDYYNAENMLLQALSIFGYNIEFNSKYRSLLPVMMLSKSNNAFMFNVYMPDMTVETKLKFPLGAPIMCETETILEKGYAHYSFAKAEHFECRVFVFQSEGKIKVKEIAPVSHRIRRRVGIYGLKNATVRFFPEKYCIDNTEAVLNSHSDNYFTGDEILFKNITDENGHYIEIENVTGSLVFSMPVKKLH